MSLPPAGLQRWTVRHKAAVIAAIDSGELTIERACELYDLSLDELWNWRDAIRHAGTNGLRTKSIQKTRPRQARKRRNAMQRTEADKLIDKFETAAVTLAAADERPAAANNPDEQVAINRANRLRREGYTRARNRLRKALEEGV
jgi:hypothetical protein